MLPLAGCGAGEDPAPGEGSSSGSAGSASPAELDASEAPAYAEIESDLWDTMQQADSVAITGEMPETLLNSEGDGEVRLTYEFSGAVDGSDSTYRRSSGDTASSDARLVDGSYYEPAEVPLRNLSRIMPDAELPESIREQTAGKWVEWTDLYGLEQRTTGVYLEDLRAALEGRDPLVTLDGETETRDGEEVWVYSDGVFEAVVRPGEDPVLLSCIGEVRDGAFELQFDGWNSSQGPGAPPEQKTMSREDLGKLLAG